MEVRNVRSDNHDLANSWYLWNVRDMKLESYLFAFESI